jgi:hypothetical protein
MDEVETKKAKRKKMQKFYRFALFASFPWLSPSMEILIFAPSRLCAKLSREPAMTKGQDSRKGAKAQRSQVAELSSRAQELRAIRL